MTTMSFLEEKIFWRVIREIYAHECSQLRGMKTWRNIWSQNNMSISFVNKIYNMSRFYLQCYTINCLPRPRGDFLNTWSQLVSRCQQSPTDFYMADMAFGLN
jgi:hypothetical protein